MNGEDGPVLAEKNSANDSMEITKGKDAD